MVVLLPVPVIPPGLMVHVPAVGNPLNVTLPVDTIHEDGCVTFPTIGAVGAGGAAFIVTSAEAFDIQPAAAVTLKL
jgi:hypothetical protein